MIHERFAERFEDWLGLVRDHHTVHGSSARGRITAENPREGFVGDPDAGIFYHPTLVVGVTADDDIYSTETFGPIVGVAKFSTFDEAMELANGHGYGLSSAIYTRSGENAFRFRERITAGMVSVNNSTSGAEAHLPFGGNGKSGNGSRQSGIWVLDQFTRWQSMNWDYAGKLQKAQMDLVELPGGHGLPPLARREWREKALQQPFLATTVGGGTSSGRCWAAGRAGSACGRRGRSGTGRRRAGRAPRRTRRRGRRRSRRARRTRSASAAKSGVWRSTP